MKNQIAISTGLILLIVNTVIGLLFTSVETTNLIITDSVLVFYFVLIILVNAFFTSDGFKISLKSLFALGTLTCYILGYCVKEPIREDSFLLSIIIISAINIIIYFITYFIHLNFK